MKLVAKQGREDLAIVYIAENSEGKRIEFVESLQPPIPREDKWVNIISTLYGCPVTCPICDAGIQYKGKLSTDELWFQLDYLVSERFGSNTVPVKKWKIQFARMGEPSFNQSVLEVLENLPKRYNALGIMPCISTIAPNSTGSFFNELLEIKQSLYPMFFQLQFSIHTTDVDVRKKLIPISCWDFSQIAEYGQKFYQAGGRKITLNFALSDDNPVDSNLLKNTFNPDVFLVKLTPLNPTYSAQERGLKSRFTNEDGIRELADELREKGFETLVSIGELEENAIGSNCGQFVSSLDKECVLEENSYTYCTEMI